MTEYQANKLFSLLMEIRKELQEIRRELETRKTAPARTSGKTDKEEATMP